MVDQVQAVKLCKQLSTAIPRLIHYPSTAETVNAAYALARPGELYCDPRCRGEEQGERRANIMDL